MDSSLDRAQAFTTGANPGGYTLSSVDIRYEDTQGDDLAVSVCTVNNNTHPTTSCTPLMVPSTFPATTTARILEFTAPANTTLAANTTYTLLITSPGGENVELHVPDSNSEDTGGAAGWSIADAYHFKNAQNVWGTTSSRLAQIITIKGTADDLLVEVNFGTNSSHTVQVREHRDVRHRFSVFLSTSRYGPPDGNPQQQPLTIPLVVTHQGGATAADYTPGIPTSVTFAVGESEAAFFIRAIPDQTIETGESLRIDFGELPDGVRKGTWGPYETVEFVDGLVPSRATVTGTTLVLTYTKVLSSASAPFRSDFTVTVDNTRVEVDQVSVSGSVVTLTLTTAVESGQTVTLDYTQGANRIRDVEGNAAMSFTDWLVTNITGGGDTDPPGDGGGGIEPPVDGGGGGTPPPGGGGGGGGGGPRTSAPEVPRNLTAVGGDGQVVLTWEPPASDGGTAITDYEYRINQTGEWISIGSTDTTHTVTGLVIHNVISNCV